LLLIADIGNTNITLGLFDGKKLVKTFRLISEKSFSYDDYIIELEKLGLENINECFICSVVDEINDSFKKACDELYKIKSLIFNDYSSLEILSEINNPSMVGVDRIANAYASVQLYSQPSIVIDLGSATTFDIISENKKFFGGIIMPGVNMQLNSLCEKTSKLPQIKAKEIDDVIGIDTETAILSGVIRGHASAIDGLISDCEKEMNSHVTIILTGGLSSLVSKYMHRKADYINENLTLEGFRYLYDLIKQA